MFEKSIERLGKHAHSAITLLAVIVAGNVFVQLYTHKTTALTAWKGGGFGMYTEPHAEARSVWITLKNGDQQTFVQLWPQTPEFDSWVGRASVKGAGFLNSMTSRADRLRYFPNAQNAADLLAQVSRVRWPDNLTGGLAPESGKVFKSKDVSLQVFENAYEIGVAEVRRNLVFDFSNGGNET